MEADNNDEHCSLNTLLKRVESLMGEEQSSWDERQREAIRKRRQELDAGWDDWGRARSSRSTTLRLLPAYVSILYKKLGIASRLEANVWAREHRFRGRSQNKRNGEATSATSSSALKVGKTEPVVRQGWKS